MEPATLQPALEDALLDRAGVPAGRRFQGLLALGVHSPPMLISVLAPRLPPILHNPDMSPTRQTVRRMRLGPDHKPRGRVHYFVAGSPISPPALLEINKLTLGDACHMIYVDAHGRVPALGDRVVGVRGRAGGVGG